MSNNNNNSVDLTQFESISAARGVSVKFRCGAVVPINHYTSKRELYFKDYCYGLGILYKKNGMLDDQGKYGSYKYGQHPFDIVEIIQPPFDWAKVKQGDKFVRKDLYVGLKTLRFQCWSTETNAAGEKLPLMCDPTGYKHSPIYFTVHPSVLVYTKE